ncbi:MAG: dissimilatory sulfite reductase (desulfoviridin), alpha/beta subunit [Desulfomicrobiaceae bacterium]|jgi:dissimilatory sulfite reductase (desulfoviridin) alpha/beta subunit|nr:dissimilatory sulfite reductase (desulfoviridin), alpha/beta subunit [Desulfomicrobiaceae bacterium]MDI3493585.1 anaerobic sulfite reductase subunit [Desulfomicrobiaceae bacterium]HCF05033.1 sulfite reductase [Desulfomicrobiaceae bacterium]
MKWTKNAEESIRQTPSFAQSRMKNQKDPRRASPGEHLSACPRQRQQHQGEIKGYRVESCFGDRGCPNRIDNGDDLLQALKRHLDSLDLQSQLQERIRGPLKSHHEFKISISHCPNACSRPQIVDVGCIGAVFPQPGAATCASCMRCIAVCREGAIRLSGGAPVIAPERCLGCGQCIRVCPTGSIEEDRRGYRVLVGGKLGRHPRLGTELPELASPQMVLEVVHRCIEHHLRHCQGERFGEVIERTGLDFLRR